MEPPGFLVIHVLAAVLFAGALVQAVRLWRQHEILRWLGMFFGLSLSGTLVSLRGLFVQQKMALLPVQSGFVHEVGAYYYGVAAALVFLGIVLLVLGMESVRRVAGKPVGPGSGHGD